MTSTGTLMAVTENSLLLFYEHTPSDNLISAIFEQERLLPIIGMNLLKEIFIVLCLPVSWDFSCGQEIGNVSIPWSIFH